MQTSFMWWAAPWWMGCLVVGVAFIAAPLVAQDDPFGEEPAEETPAADDPFGGPPTPQPKPPVPKPEEPLPDATRPVAPPPSGFEVELLDGTLLRGELNVSEIAVATKYGDLKIPIAELVSISPGLNTRVEQKAHLAELIERLGAEAYADRQQATEELVALGPQVTEIVTAATASDNAERATRAKAILDGFAALEQTWGKSAAEPLAELDEVTTREFAASGQVQLKSLAVEGLYGTVNVELQHVRRLRRATALRAGEAFSSTKVTAEHIVGNKQHVSPILVRRGDTVSIRASGALKRSGSSTMFRPEGDANHGYYSEPQRIMTGALMVQIGEGGDMKLAGAKGSFVADADGPLVFGIAANAQYVRYNLEGSYDVNVRISSPK